MVVHGHCKDQAKPMGWGNCNLMLFSESESVNETFVNEWWVG